MREITREQFIKELEALGEEQRFNVKSVDSGSISIALYGCKIETMVEVAMTEGENGAINIFKPHTAMDVMIDFEIVESITREDSTYTIEFNNGLSDVEIEIVNKEM